MLLGKDGESFKFNVGSCCGFIDVEKGAYFGHLKSFFCSKFHRQSVLNKIKKIVEANIL